MISILVFAAIVVIVLALVCYAISLLPMIQSPFKQILMILSILIAVLIICHRAGLI